MLLSVYMPALYQVNSLPVASSNEVSLLNHLQDEGVDPEDIQLLKSILIGDDDQVEEQQSTFDDVLPATNNEDSIQHERKMEKRIPEAELLRILAKIRAQRQAEAFKQQLYKAQIARYISHM